MAYDIFMSYTSVKDVYGAVSEFLAHLEIELIKKTGDRSLTVFQDKRGIHGGDKWEEILVDQLNAAKLLLVLLSPTWLASEWCMKEYEIFRGTGTNRPILPLMWDDISDVNASPRAIRILSELKKYQKFEWGDLQYADWAKPEPKMAAARLAEAIKLQLKKHESTRLGSSRLTVTERAFV